MIRVALYLLGAATFAGVAWRYIHAQHWNTDLFGPAFAMLALTFVFTCLGLGELWGQVRLAIARIRFARAVGIAAPNYVVVDDPQPTL